MTGTTRRRPLARKFALAFVGLVSVVLLLNGATTLWLAWQESRRATLDAHQDKAAAAAERIIQFIAGIERELGWTTRIEWARLSLEQRRYDFIRLLRQTPAITELIQLDGAGKERLRLSRLEPDAVDSGNDLSREPYFTEAVAHQVWYGPVYFRRGSEPYMTLAVAHAGRNPGVTVAEVNLKLIWDVVSAIRVGEHGLAYITDGRGRLVAHPDIGLVLRDTDMAPLPQVAAAIGAGAQAGAGTTADARDLRGRGVLSAHATIPSTGWLVFVEQPVDEALGPIYLALERGLLLLALALAVAIAAGIWLGRRMVVPIRQLAAGAQRLGEGDLGQRIDIATGDEIETLADRFNVMAGQIQESYATLERKVEERTRDLNQTLQQQTATADVLRVISNSPGELEPVFQAILESATRLCDANFAILQLYRDDAFHVVAQHNVPRPFAEYLAAHGPRHPAPGTALARLVETRAAVHVADITADPAYAAGVAYRRAAVDLGAFRTLQIVPMMKDQELVGAIAIYRQEVQPEPEKLELLETFADQAVIAIENARLFGELRDSLAQQTATADALKVISRSAFDLDAVFRHLIETAARLCDASMGLLFRRDGEVFRLAARWGASDDLMTYIDSHPLSSGRGTVVGRAALERATVHVPDIDADPEYALRDAPRIGGWRSVLCVPLLREGEPLGALALARPTAGPFTQRQIDLVQTFADQAVIALENARLIENLEERTRELGRSLADLRATQDRLIQSEKLASLGQLTAGIAHEIKNPLNFVNNFASLSAELADELRELVAGSADKLAPEVRAEIDETAGLLRSNLEKIRQHGQRADSIVKNMLMHSRQEGGERRNVDLNAMVEEALNLAYHGARAERPGFNIELVRRLDAGVGVVDVYPQELTRVLLNLFSNGFYAAHARKAAGDDPGFKPTLTVVTRAVGDRVEIRVHDNGTGIPEAVKAQIFNPFFTTKPAGEGTGLGLSISYDIVVKQHGGMLDVETVPGQFTEFILSLPRARPSEQAA